jgi:cell division protein FtsI (penicillin-binding protein 3)
MAAQLLGIVGVDGHGLDGLEFALDGRLRGDDGRRRLVKDALGDTIELRDTRATEPGQRVRLTLDANIQDRTEEVLAEVGREWKPKGATALVMDPRDGAILAMANWPQVDANDLPGAPDYAKQNRAIGANYEPGSTFKPFTVAGALEDGKVTPRTQFSLPPVLQVADRTIKEAHDRGWTTLDTSQILAQSSNIGTVKIGQELGERRFDHWIRRFGFGGRTGVDLPGEEAGIVPSVEQYSGASIGNLPIGQGLAVTPMQIATAYAAIANGGILRPPHMVEAVGGQRARKPAGRRIVSRHTAAAIAKMLEGVLGPGGTATGAKIDGYAVAGKTGTAQKPIPGGYSATKYVASFAGFAPVRNPRLLVTVMVDEPQGDIYGGSIAAPAFKKITSFALNYLAIPPD